MREIKFRAWQKGSSLHRKRGMYFVDHLVFHDQGGGGEAFLHLPGEESQSSEYFDDIYLMQYTGHEDFDGNPIYEGDIWQPYHHNWKNPSEDKPLGVPFVIAYEEMSNCGHCCDDTGIGFNFHGKEYGKVIGNIYENPELLKESA